MTVSNRGAIARADLAAEVDVDRLNQHVRETSYGYRMSGSEDEAHVFDYIGNALADLGYDVVRESAVTLIGLPGEASVEVISPVPMTLRGYGYSMSPPTPPEGVVGVLADISHGLPANYPGESLAGRVLLSEGIAMPAKVIPADRSGALAQIHVNGERFHEMCISAVWGSPTPETFDLLPRTPSLGIIGADGIALRELMRQGPVVVRVRTTSQREWRPIPSLAATLAGRESELFTLFGGHVDSWHAGAMDNASGNSVQLETARVLAAHRDSLRRGARFVFFSGHSQGRYAGSTWYADHHWQDLFDHCACFMNIDSVGGINADVLSDAPSMAESYAFAADLVKELTGAELGYRRAPRSSEESFLGVGITALFSTLSEQSSSGALVEAARALLTEGVKRRGSGFGWWWHTVEDTLDKVDPQRLLRDARVYAATNWDLCSREVLPFDFAATAREVEADLSALDVQVQGHFELSGLIQHARRLAGKAERLRGAPVSPFRLNETLVSLGRALIPVTFTRAGAFDQDPAVGLPALPGLAPGVRLATLAPDSDAWHALEVREQRERNRLEAALTQAERLVDSVLAG